MRNTSLLLTSFLLTGLASGCTSPEARAADGMGPPEPVEVARKRADDDKADAKEAAQAMRDYAYAQKAEFVVDMNKELATIQAELGRLSAKIDHSTGTVKADAKVALEKVRAQWALAMKQLVEAERAPENTWNDTKVGFRKAYDELKDAVAKSRHWLSEKIEP